MNLHDELPADRRPLSSNLDILRRVAAFGYFAGALVLISTIWLPDPDPRDHHALLLIGIGEVAAGLILQFGKRLPDWAIKVIAISGAILATSLVVAVFRPMGVVPLYYLWPALTGGYFGSRREAIWNFVFFCVAFAVALLLSPSAEMRTSVYSATVLFYGSVSFIMLRLTAEVEDLMHELHHTASVDSLTGLLNRRSFTTAFEREIDRARRAGLPLSVVLFDLDFFKFVNDRFGHAAGDACLQRFATLLDEERRPSDIVARIGGEEFTAVLFGADEREAEGFAERVCARVKELHEEPRLSTSAGVASLDDEHDLGDTLLQAADRALYTAKANGRDCVVLADDPTVLPLEQVV
jgi:diguanylate cyclase (GGDEF)-like protein